MSNLFKRHIITLLLLFSSSILFAQSTNWDKVLDEYERICNECIIIRTRIAQGEAVPEGSVTSILNKLTGLRNSLQGSTGSMTQTQARRFNQIRDRYSAVMGTFAPSQMDTAEGGQGDRNPSRDNAKRSSTGPAVSTERSGDPSRASVPERDLTGDHALTVQDSAQQAGKAFLNILEDETAKTYLSIEAAGLSGSKALDRVLSAQDIADETSEIKLSADSSKKSLEYFALASAQLGRQTSWGALLGVKKGRIGGFLSARSNFKKAQSSGQVQSDGTILPGKEKIISSGKTVYETWNAVLGPMFSVTDWLDLYAGAGYGQRRLSWEDVSGKWLEVTDFSKKGLAFEGGAVLSFNRLCLGVGVCYLNEVDATVSLGVRF